MVKGKGGGAPGKPRQSAKGAKNDAKGSDQPENGAAETKSAVAEPAKSNILTEDQQRALFFNHTTIFKKALEAKKKADADFRNACKLIKSEQGSVDDIKLAIQLEERAGELAAKATIERQLQIARWVGADFGHQFTLLEEPSVLDKAFELGKIEGLKGTPKKPPYDHSVPQYKRWMEGYDEGQAVLVKKFTPPAPEPKKPPAPPADNVVPLKGDQPVH